MELSQQLAISSSLSASFILFVCLYLLLDLLSGGAHVTNPYLLLSFAAVWLCSLTAVLGTYFYIKKRNDIVLVVSFLAGSFVIILTCFGGILLLIFGEFAFALMLISTSLFSLVSIFLNVDDN